jgi:DNA-binding transcriptional LysR family regulator
LSAVREKPGGIIRISAGEHPAVTVLQPALNRLLPNYPGINVEISVDYGLTDIVAEGYDAGVRLGEQVAKDNPRSTGSASPICRRTRRLSTSSRAGWFERSKTIPSLLSKSSPRLTSIQRVC